MSHPHNDLRAHKVEKSRLGMYGCGGSPVMHRASGGAVDGDAREDKALVKSMVKGASLKSHGGKVKHRGDRPGRAKGGRIHKGKGHTSVNVIVAPQGGAAHPPMPMPPPGVGAAPMRPPMPAPAPPAMPGPALPPGAAPPGMRRTGGRTYASGGSVQNTNWKEGIRHGTKVQHSDGKDDGKNIGRGKPITYKTGGAVEHPVHGGMAPHLPSGSGGGEAKLFKAHRAAKNYAKPGPSVNAGAHG
jgi:hypothetical protein